MVSATALIPQQKPQVTAQNRVFERDRISDIGRAARLGQKLPGMADVYEHLTPEMKRRTEGAAGPLGGIRRPADQQRARSTSRDRPT
jgi:hypothetical protein